MFAANDVATDLRRVWSKASLIALGALTVVTAIALATFQDYGIGWDGRVQAIYGHKLLAYYASGFADHSAFTYSDLYLYGGFFDLVAALVERISPVGEFETRHLLGGTIYLIGVVGAWRLTKLLAGERAAMIAVLGALTTPLLYGHAFINPKDSPFAWVLLWVTYFACRLVKDRPTTWTWSHLGFAVTLGIAIGTRVFALAYFGYLIVIVAGSGLASPRLRGTWEPWRALVWVVAAAPLVAAVTVVFWPWAAQAPGNLVASIHTFLHFPHRVPVLWEGEILPSTQPPASYLWVLLALQLPEYILVGMAIVAALPLLSRKGPNLNKGRDRALLFVWMTALVPLIAFMVLRPTIYNGLRQFLFVVPPLVVLAAIGIDAALRRMAARPMLAGGAVAVLLLAAGREVVVMNDLHPYEYVAFNGLAGQLPGVAGKFELDYWGTSLAEASRKLTALVAPGTPARVFVCGDRESAAYFMPATFQIAAKPDEADFIVAPTEPVCRNLTRRSMRVIAEVARDGVVLSRVFDLRPTQLVEAPRSVATSVR